MILCLYIVLSVVKVDSIERYSNVEAMINADIH